jgi:uncharacterized protein YbjT (DUF2867 family)
MRLIMKNQMPTKIKTGNTQEKQVARNVDSISPLKVTLYSSASEISGIDPHGQVARILQAGRVPTTDLRTPMILGSGSASFEILRYLVERLPAMTTPRWVRSQNQPIAISNVIGYLVGCLEHPETTGETYDIGGPDIMTYQRLLEIYAEEAGLRKRVIIPVPVLTPTLSALWINLISPVPKSIALPLTEGLAAPTATTSRRCCGACAGTLIASRAVRD